MVQPRSIDLPEVIPLFPLAGALLLPRATLPLHIFEPRYLQMVEESLKTPSRLIGMIQPRGEDESDLCSIGCAGRITAFNELDDGRMMISLTGVSRFRLRRFAEGFTPWLRGTVGWRDFAADLREAEHDPGLNRTEFLEATMRYLRMHELSTDLDVLTAAGDEQLIDALSMLLPFAPEDRQALLESPTLSDRRVTLQMLIGFALHGGDGDILQ